MLFSFSVNTTESGDASASMKAMLSVSMVLSWTVHDHTTDCLFIEKEENSLSLIADKQ